MSVYDDIPIYKKTNMNCVSVWFASGQPKNRWIFRLWWSHSQSHSHTAFLGLNQSRASSHQKFHAMVEEKRKKPMNICVYMGLLVISSGVHSVSHGSTTKTNYTVYSSQVWGYLLKKALYRRKWPDGSFWIATASTRKEKCVL